MAERLGPHYEPRAKALAQPAWSVRREQFQSDSQSVLESPEVHDWHIEAAACASDRAVTLGRLPRYGRRHRQRSRWLHGLLGRC
jgi:hypothetical protein